MHAVTTPLMAIHTQRFTVHSSIDVPMTVDATDWVSALTTVMTLLERSERLDFLVCEVDTDGRLTAKDPDTGEVYALMVGMPASRAA